MTRILAAMLMVFLSVPGAGADPARLWAMLRLDDLIEVMAEEGRSYGADLAAEAFEWGGGPAWDERVAGIYDPEEMAAEIEPLFLAAVEGVDTVEIEAFLASDLGQRIIDADLDARAAFLDEEFEAAAREKAEQLERRDPEKYALIQEFIEVNDLIENNVAASLTFSYAFNIGLIDGGAEGMSESDVLSDAWAQEEEIREDSRRWLEAQLSVSFAPLSDEELRQYIEISRTDAGVALNNAMFSAFEPSFTRIAAELGEAVASSIAGRDI